MLDNIEAAMLSLPTLKYHCRQEIQRNVELWTEYSTIDQFCYNQCGEHGTCVHGNMLTYGYRKLLIHVNIKEDMG